MTRSLEAGHIVVPTVTSATQCKAQTLDEVSLTQAERTSCAPLPRTRSERRLNASRAQFTLPLVPPVCRWLCTLISSDPDIPGMVRWSAAEAGGEIRMTRWMNPG